MNKMHQAAKIAFVTFAIYIIIGLISSMFTSVNMIITRFSLGTVVIFITTFGISGLYIWMLIYFLIIKRDKFATKIIGDTEMPMSTNAVAWIPLAYRLVCIIAGLILVYRIIWNITLVLSQYITIKEVEPGPVTSHVWSQILQRNVVSLILLPFAIYLLCGAPHFVRWQVKKTLELCDQFADNVQNQKSNDLQAGE